MEQLVDLGRTDRGEGQGADRAESTCLRRRCCSPLLLASGQRWSSHQVQSSASVPVRSSGRGGRPLRARCTRLRRRRGSTSSSSASAFASVLERAWVGSRRHLPVASVHFAYQTPPRLITLAIRYVPPLPPQSFACAPDISPRAYAWSSEGTNRRPQPMPRARGSSPRSAAL